MAVENSLVVAKQREDVWQSVVIGDQRQVCVQVSCEVVDLEVVVCLGGLWVWRGCVHVLVRIAPFALEVGRRVLHMVGVGHVEVDKGVRVVTGHVVRAEGGAGKNMAVECSGCSPEGSSGRSRSGVGGRVR